MSNLKKKKTCSQTERVSVLKSRGNKSLTCTISRDTRGYTLERNLTHVISVIGLLNKK